MDLSAILTPTYSSSSSLNSQSTNCAYHATVITLLLLLAVMEDDSDQQYCEINDNSGTYKHGTTEDHRKKIEVVAALLVALIEKRQMG
jgi:hypothetical protein